MYAKIFSQIYDGTLCTHGPWQALVVFQQFLVLSDQHGIVDMTPAAISRRTTIPIEIIEIGIAALLKPDPESRTPTEEGKRIVPLSQERAWGWRIVNYVHYRQMQREVDRRDYQRQYWSEKRSPRIAKATSNAQQPLNSTQHTQPNQPIAKANTDANTNALNTVDQPDGFDRFYQAYPKKVAAEAARKAFKTVKANDSLDQILTDISSRLSKGVWKTDKENKRFIPNPATYLNGLRWKDEIPADGLTSSSRHCGFAADKYEEAANAGIPE